jgi:hypothetical protein
MPVAKAIFLPLARIYGDLLAKKTDSARARYLINRRAEIKTIVDTIWEQCCSVLCQTNPRNATEAQRDLGALDRTTLNAEDARVAEDLLAVLESYDPLSSSDPYIDHGQPMANLVNKHLRKLAATLAAHPSQVAHSEAAALGRVLALFP